jgi:hypothetical protein
MLDYTREFPVDGPLPALRSGGSTQILPAENHSAPVPDPKFPRADLPDAFDRVVEPLIAEIT